MNRYFYTFAFLLLAACKHDPDPKPPTETADEEALSGGKDATIADVSANAFGRQVPGLTTDQQTSFVVGNSFFRSNWVAAPASASARDGLGPIMNATNCGACHPQDGRGLAPDFGTDNMNGLLLRIGTADGQPDPMYGDQFQNKAIQGMQPEGFIARSNTQRTVSFADGNSTILNLPQYSISSWAYGAPGSIVISPRIGQQLPGIGLLEAITPESIVALADEADADGDGISGRVRWITGQDGIQRIGRFGWKAGRVDIADQAGAAFANDMGITSPNFRRDGMTDHQVARYPNIPNGGDPEIDDSNFEAVKLYLQALAVPARRNTKDANVVAGKALFATLGCAKCHTPTFTTGAGALPQLTNQTIHPYTDLLLHDMGEDLADHRAEGTATGTEWRTAPLWGLGLIKTVSTRADLLHDGRAQTVEQAILWHGGEAQAARNGYVNLPQSDRDKLLAFLNSL